MKDLNIVSLLQNVCLAQIMLLIWKLGYTLEGNKSMRNWLSWECLIESVLLFWLFFFKESLKASSESVQLDIYLMNGQKVALNIQSTDRTDDVLEVRGFVDKLPHNNITVSYYSRLSPTLLVEIWLVQQSH